MIQIKWKVDDGKTRPAIGLPKVGVVYAVPDRAGHSYVAQKMATYADAKLKDKPKSETKLEGGNN